MLCCIEAAGTSLPHWLAAMLLCFNVGVPEDLMLVYSAHTQSLCCFTCCIVLSAVLGEACNSSWIRAQVIKKLGPLSCIMPAAI